MAMANAKNKNAVNLVEKRKLAIFFNINYMIIKWNAKLLTFCRI
jgi:hypothetical protein